MLEPTWNPTAARMTRAPGPRARTKAEGPELNWLVDAAPYVVAALWMVVTFAALLCCAGIGRRDLLDWCRSGAVLTGAGTLAALAALVATVRKGSRSRFR